MGVEDGIQFDSAERFDFWLVGHGATERELWVIIFNKMILHFFSLLLLDYLSFVPYLT